MQGASLIQSAAGRGEIAHGRISRLKPPFPAGKSNFQVPKGPCGHDTRNKGLQKSKKSNFQLPKGPCGHDTRNKGLEKINKSNFQLPKGPCGHDIRSAGFEKPFKVSSRQVKMEKCCFMKKWNIYWKNKITSNFLMKKLIKR